MNCRLAMLRLPAANDDAQTPAPQLKSKHRINSSHIHDVLGLRFIARNLPGEGLKM